MPEFRNREQYEKQKGERMQEWTQTPSESEFAGIPRGSQFSPEADLGVPGEEEKKRRGNYVIWAVVLLVAFLSVVIIYRQFFQAETWTDSSYTNRKLGFTMGIPEGWSRYDFTFKGKARQFASEGRGRVLFVLSPDNRKDIGYTLMFVDMKGIKTGIVDAGASINSLASAFSRQGLKTEQFIKTIGKIDIPFLKASRRSDIFIMGNFMVSTEKMFFVQFISDSDEYEEEFWNSIESFEVF